MAGAETSPYRRIAIEENELLGAGSHTNLDGNLDDDCADAVSHGGGIVARRGGRWKALRYFLPG